MHGNQPSRRHTRLRPTWKRAGLAVAALALIAVPAAWASHEFNDVPTSSPHHADISAISAAGITSGCGPALYCPDQFVRRDQMASFINRTRLFAVVNANATLARGSHVSSVVTTTTGNYRVIFDRNVRNCAYVATIGLSGASGTSAPGFVTTVGDALSVNGVFVTTDNVAGASTDLGFHLDVTC
jgi:hypothetical protein